MAVRPILQIGDPTLRVPGEQVTTEQLASEPVQALIDDLIDTMHHANGAGLAATQVGAALRIAVMEVSQNPRYPYKPDIPLTVAVNPVIEPLDEELVDINEGCLSVPLRGNVERYVNIRVRYLDRHGAQHDEVKRGLTAGTWQHECDHLDGVLFIDRVTDPTTISTWEEFERHHRAAFHRTHHGVRRPGGLVTDASGESRSTYWCEMAVVDDAAADALQRRNLQRRTRQPGSRRRGDDRRGRRSHQFGPVRFPTTFRVNSSARADGGWVCERSQSCVSPRVARPNPVWCRDVLDVARSHVSRR